MVNTSIKVCIRTCPFSQTENEILTTSVKVEEDVTTLLKYQDKPGIQFKFDQSYWSTNFSTEQNYADQNTIYNDIGEEVVRSAKEGFNSTVFCYGQTGSGKTYTMMGTTEQPGLIPRIAKELVKMKEESCTQSADQKSVTMSYLEVYKEKIRDLLAFPASSSHHKHRQTAAPNLQLHCDAGVSGTVQIRNLTQRRMHSPSDVEDALRVGNKRRQTATTAMNKESSRSHAIVCLTYRHATFEEGAPSETSSKIYLVDLAGSERASKSGLDGERLQEGKFINCSLSSLCSVIRSLNKIVRMKKNGVNSSKVHVPYRDSVLTRLLQDSLGGNSKTFMIATISPSLKQYHETLSTLRYASQVMAIHTTPTVNEDPHVQMIRELREQITQLQTRITANECSDRLPKIDCFDDELSAELCLKQEREQHMTRQWHERWHQSKKVLLHSTAVQLKKSNDGHGVVLVCAEPHLLVLEDNDTSDVGALYHLAADSTTTIGTDDINTIAVKGAGLQGRHCSLTVEPCKAQSAARVVLTPHPGALCAVNTLLHLQPTLLSHGDVLLLGQEYLVRFNNPAEEQSPRKESSRLSLSQLSFRNMTDSMMLTETDWGSQSWSSSPITLQSPANHNYRSHRFMTDAPIHFTLEEFAAIEGNGDTMDRPYSPCDSGLSTCDSESQSVTPFESSEDYLDGTFFSAVSHFSVAEDEDFDTHRQIRSSTPCREETDANLLITDTLVDYYSKLEKQLCLESPVNDVTKLFLPGSALSKHLALILEKAVQERLKAAQGN